MEGNEQSPVGNPRNYGVVWGIKEGRSHRKTIMLQFEKKNVLLYIYKWVLPEKFWFHSRGRLWFYLTHFYNKAEIPLLMDAFYQLSWQEILRPQWQKLFLTSVFLWGRKNGCATRAHTSETEMTADVIDLERSLRNPVSLWTAFPTDSALLQEAKYLCTVLKICLKMKLELATIHFFFCF